MTYNCRAEDHKTQQTSHLHTTVHQHLSEECQLFNAQTIWLCINKIILLLSSFFTTVQPILAVHAISNYSECRCILHALYKHKKVKTCLNESEVLTDIRSKPKLKLQKWAMLRDMGTIRIAYQALNFTTSLSSLEGLGSFSC